MFRNLKRNIKTVAKNKESTSKYVEERLTVEAAKIQAEAVRDAAKIQAEGAVEAAKIQTKTSRIIGYIGALVTAGGATATYVVTRDKDAHDKLQESMKTISALEERASKLQKDLDDERELGKKQLDYINELKEKIENSKKDDLNHPSSKCNIM